ncbi:hypothetical protein CYMTET_43662 [Cymbomonas tetramitiformis]|uniref:Uncharacterized protein n=1 Tax=Cymbomonas tetramitiformis TaxID=36881 RepID=A0AAE0F0E6_9CHLO|nr:hypothetical protein CYMTET_43662 [Cymbomonas tetramitiformis]
MSDDARRRNSEMLHGVVAMMSRVDARFRFLGAIAFEEESIKSGDCARHQLLKRVVRERMRSEDASIACGLLLRKRGPSGCDENGDLCADDDNMLVFKKSRNGRDDAARVDERIDRWLTTKTTRTKCRECHFRIRGRRTKINAWVRDMKNALRVWVDVHVYVYDQKKE